MGPTNALQDHSKDNAGGYKGEEKRYIGGIPMLFENLGISARKTGGGPGEQSCQNFHVTRMSE